jgi:hypothetical protein
MSAGALPDEELRPEAGTRGAAEAPVLHEFVPGQIWIKEHPIRLAGGRFLTRMTVLRIADGLCLHSPVPIDGATRDAIERLGEVRGIIAPSNCHHLFVANAQRAFPDAPTYGVPGLDTKRRDLRFDALLGDQPIAQWAGQMDQVSVGNPVMHEVDFFHRASRTLIATDLVENFSDETPGTNAMLRVWLRLFSSWGRPCPAPELRWFTRDRQRTRLALESLLAWDFDRAVIAHGDLLLRDPKNIIREAWAWLLRA